MAIDEYILSLRKDFFEEAFEMLEMLESNILNITNNHDDDDAIQEIFRAVHTLKGSAGAVELTEVASYTHRFEDLLDLIRMGKITIDDDTIDVLLHGIDNIKELVMSAYEERDTTIDTSKEIATLERFRDDRLSGGGSSPKTYDSSEVQSSGEVDTNVDNVNEIVDLNIDNELLDSISEMKDSGLHIYSLHISFDTENPMRTVGGVQVFVNLKQIGDVISTVPPLADLEGEEFYQNVIYVLSTDKNKDEVKAYIEAEDITESITVIDFNIDKYSNYLSEKNEDHTLNATTVAETATTSSTSNSKEVKEVKNQGANTEVKKDKHTTFLRVESDRIDAMLNQVGELVINKSTYQQHEEDFLSYLTNTSLATNELKKYFRTTMVRLAKMLENTMEKQDLKVLRNE